MSATLLDLTKLAVHTQAVEQVAIDLGFASVGDIDRFLFKSYGKTIRDIPPANRPRGAVFFLAPPASATKLARPSDLKPVLLKIQSEVAKRFYQVPMDVTGSATAIYETTSKDQRLMASGAWPLGMAQSVSRTLGKCVVWGNGVSATVFLNGDIYLESPDVVAELPSGLPTSFQSLSWSDGEIVYEFAENELNDTSEAGIWRLPDQFLLRPKPEKLMSVTCPRLSGRATVIQGDARAELDRVGVGEDLYDGILTSPPYLNSFDYTDIYRPELLLLNAARNSSELRKLRFGTLRSHVQVAWKPSAPLGIQLLQKTIAAIDRAGSWCGRIPEMVNAYFVDLDHVIEQCGRKLKRGATVEFVVADSAYCGVVIPVDLILSEIFERQGFATKKITLFRKTLGNGNHQSRSSEQLKEVMVVAEYHGSARRKPSNRRRSTTT